MDIDIHLVERQQDIQHERGISPLYQKALIRLFHGGGDGVV